MSNVRHLHRGLPAIRCVQCRRAPRHAFYVRCRGCMARIWRAAAAKAARSRKRRREASI
jgi:hypothetical protein